MRSESRKLSRGVFGALVLGALGFGATQALATPGTARDAAYCTREDFAACTAECQEALGPGWRGKCTTNSFGQKSCQCVEVIFPSGS